MSTVAFGSVDVLPGTAIASSGVLSVSCLNVQVGAGSLYVCVAFPTPRLLQGPGATLSWDLFGPPPGLTSWSNTTAIAIPLSTLLGGGATVTIPASIQAVQANRPPGVYQQTLTATATYGTTTCTDILYGPVSFTFQATATVLKSCNVSAGNLAFGSVGNLSVAMDGQSQVAVQCSAGTGYSVSLDGGLSAVADPIARLMTAGSNSVAYGLYQNAARTTPWGAASANIALSATGTSTMQIWPVYGRVAAQTTPPPGTYSDTVVVSVTY